MQVINDCGNHGYTVDNKENRWFWKITSEGLEFRHEAGSPITHPIHENNTVPDAVAEATRKATRN